jgi:hypothetical protein
MAVKREEKREFLRVPFVTEAQIIVGDCAIRSTTGIDVSLSGLRLSTAETAPPVGAPCSVKIRLGGREQELVIEAQGAVIRTEPGHVAVRFSELDYDSYQHLRQLILLNSEDPERAEEEFSEHWGIRRPAPPSDQR